MRIDSIEIFRGSVPDSAPDGEPHHAAHPRRETVLVRLTAAGFSGWGEAVCGTAPTERPEWSASVLACLTDWLAPAVLGQDIPSGEALQAALAPFAGNALAKSALDLAWWDLKARSQSMPLWQMLGGQQPWVEVGATIRPQSTEDDLLRAVGEAFELGYSLVTLEVRPGWDLPMLRGVRQAFPTQRLALDFRGAATLEQRDLFFRMEDFQPAWFEQPLAADDLVGHAMLQEGLRTPICMSEGVDSPHRVRQAADLGSCRLVRIDLTRAGGLTPALAIQAQCCASGIGCLAATDASGLLGTYAALALSTLRGATQPAVTLPWGETARPTTSFDLVRTLGQVPAESTSQVPAANPAGLAPKRCPQDGGVLGVELPVARGLGRFLAIGRAPLAPQASNRAEVGRTNFFFAKIVRRRRWDSSRVDRTLLI